MTNHTTVKQLIELLEELNPDSVVVMSSDAEGNNYSPLYAVDPNCVYVPETKWWGHVYLPELTEDLIKNGYTDEDIYYGTEGLPAVVLAPVN